MEGAVGCPCPWVGPSSRLNLGRVAQPRMFFHILGAIGQFERDLIQERTRAGLEAAKARGRTGGRPRALTAEQVQLARQLVDEGKSVAEVSKLFEVAYSTLHDALRRRVGD